eukprot:g43297.t1
MCSGSGGALVVVVEWYGQAAPYQLQGAGRHQGKSYQRICGGTLQWAEVGGLHNPVLAGRQERLPCMGLHRGRHLVPCPCHRILHQAQNLTQAVGRYALFQLAWHINQQVATSSYSSLKIKSGRNKRWPKGRGRQRNAGKTQKASKELVKLKGLSV